MVSHQHVGVNLQAVVRGAPGQQTKIVVAIVVIQKDRALVDSALGDVERYPGYFQASLPKHVWGRRGERQGLSALQRMASPTRHGLGKRHRISRSLDFLRPGFGAGFWAARSFTSV